MSDNETKDKTPRLHQLQSTVFLFGIIVYEILVVSLLGKELYETAFRATNQVFILLALMSVPFLLVAIRNLIGGFNTVNLQAGGLGVQLEKLESDVARAEEKIEEKAQQLEEQLTGKFSTAEQALYPMVGGVDFFSLERVKQGRLIIGSKDFASNIILAEILAQFLEINGYLCERRIPNGGSISNFASLSNAWTDLYVDYTGTGCLFMNIDHRGKSQTEILELLNRISLQRYQFEWLKPLGTVNNFCLVMAPQIAKELDIVSISDLAEKARGELRFCCNYEFLGRFDGLEGLKEWYNLRFAEENICSYKNRYDFLRSGDMDRVGGIYK